MYDKTITIFNYHKPTDLWFITKVEGADVGAVKASSSTVSSGKTNSDSVVFVIPSDADGNITFGGKIKTHLGPKEYSRCADPSEHFTFNSETDFIYVGDWDEFIDYKDSDYENGLYNEMNREYDGVYLIGSSAYYGLLPHYEVGGR